MIKPLRDLLVIEPEQMPGFVGLIYLPDLRTSTSNKSSVPCRVVAAGPDVELAHVGERVLVQSYGCKPAGDEVIVAGKVLTLIRERDIVGVLEELQRSRAPKSAERRLR